MNLKYKLHPSRFVYCSLVNFMFNPEDILFSFREEEGITFVVSEEVARLNNILFEETWALISVETITSLNSTGITAHISALLSKHKIPCNIVAGFYHDYLLVPYDSGSEAVQVLEV